MPCYKLDRQSKTCLSDVEKIFQVNSDEDCAKGLIDELYAMIQSLEMTAMFVTVFVLLVKICSVNYDSPRLNKLIKRQYLALLMWAVFELINIASLFFVQPWNLFDKYVKPFGPYPVRRSLFSSHDVNPVTFLLKPNEVEDEYKTSAVFII